MTSIKPFSEIIKLTEGGPRKNISQEVIDKFIHQLLLVQDPTRRQEIVDEIFSSISEKNREAWLKDNPEIAAAEAAAKVNQVQESQLREYGFIHRDAEDIKQDIRNLKRLKLKMSEIEKQICEERGISPRTFRAIIADGKERTADKKRIAAERKHFSEGYQNYNRNPSLLQKCCEEAAQAFLRFDSDINYYELSSDLYDFISKRIDKYL